MTRRVFISDVTLRDGNHILRNQYTTGQVRAIAAALDAAGVDSIEVGHADGLGSPQSGFGLALHTNLELIEAVAPMVRRAEIATLAQPSRATTADLANAAAAGVGHVRIATHCTQADTSNQLIGAARNLGLGVSGFLMMAGHATPRELAQQARLMERFGAQCVYLADSDGSLTEPAVVERVRAIRETLAEITEVGIHAHDHLGLSIANAVAAVEAGACRVDASLDGIGAGPGNTPIEEFVAIADWTGWQHGSRLSVLTKAARDLVRPLHRPAELAVRPSASMASSDSEGHPASHNSPAQPGQVCQHTSRNEGPGSQTRLGETL